STEVPLSAVTRSSCISDIEKTRAPSARILGADLAHQLDVALDCNVLSERVLKHMAVFTHVSHDDARQLLTRYDIGELVSLRGITAGIENTNYFLTTTQGEFVLTLFEVLTERELPFYIE